MTSDQSKRIRAIIEVLRERTKMDGNRNNRWDQDEASSNLAYFLWVKWGQDFTAAHGAWCRLMQNTCSLSSFEKLVKESDFYINHAPKAPYYASAGAMDCGVLTCNVCGKTFKDSDKHTCG